MRLRIEVNDSLVEVYVDGTKVSGVEGFALTVQPGVQPTLSIDLSDKVQPEMRKHLNKIADIRHKILPDSEWAVRVRSALEAGGTLLAPTGGEPRVIKADGTLMEHEHADHPDYKFPVKVARQSNSRPLHWEEHAFVFSDGSVALTLFEYCYALWHLRTGRFIGGSLWNSDFFLSAESIRRIVRWIAPRTSWERMDPVLWETDPEGRCQEPEAPLDLE